MVGNNNEFAGYNHHQHGTNSIGTDSNELQLPVSRHQLELELKLTMAEKDKAELQARIDKLHEENRMLQRQLGKYEGIQMEKNHQREVNTRLIERIERLSRELGKKEGAQEMLVRRLTDVETALAQNSQFLFGEDELDLKPLESVHEDYEEKDEDAEQDEIDESKMGVYSDGSNYMTMNVSNMSTAGPHFVHGNSDYGTLNTTQQDSFSSLNQDNKFSDGKDKEKITAITRRRPRNSQQHHFNRIFPCDLCPKTFGNKRQLRRHYCSHTGEKSFKCIQCGKAFARNDVLTRHIRQVHKDVHSVRVLPLNLSGKM